MSGIATRRCKATPSRRHGPWRIARDHRVVNERCEVRAAGRLVVGGTAEGQRVGGGRTSTAPGWIVDGSAMDGLSSSTVAYDTPK